MNRALSLPLAASITGHACILAPLLLLVGQVPPLPIAKPGIEVMLAPPGPVTDAPQPPSEQPPIPEEGPPPPEPAPPIVEAEPLSRITPPAPAEPPSSRTKAVALRRRREPQRMPVPETGQLLSSAPMQTAAIPKIALPAPAIVSAGYRALLRAWLEHHKHYPGRARARGEEGRAVLRFHVNRMGRVLSYALIQSTGHPDLDAAIDQMMRGASLPPFPADMAASDVEVSVPIRFEFTP